MRTIQILHKSLSQRMGFMRASHWGAVCRAVQALVADRQIVLTAQAVRLAFAATPPPGDDFTCPSNPEVPVTVELPEPVGDREIIEGHAVGPTLSDFLP